MKISKLLLLLTGNELNYPIKFLFLDSVTDPDDNILTIKCRADKKFDIPDKLPDCLAQCAKEKPLPPPENNIVLDTTRTPDRKLWENEYLW